MFCIEPVQIVLLNEPRKEESKVQEKRTIKLSVIIGTNPIGEYSFELSEGEELTLGRSADNMLSIPSRLVSRRHGVIRLHNGRLEFADCCSSNGTLVGSRFLRGNAKEDGISEWIPMETPGILKIDSVSGSLNEHVEILVSTSQALAAKRVPLDPQKECTIGRAASCTVCLPHVTISRIHAVIRYTHGKWMLEDRHSRNGLTLNSVPVYGQMELHEHDTIRICRELLIFMGDYLEVIESCAAGVRLQVNDLCKAVTEPGGLSNKTKILLNHVSLNIQPGELIAIIGGSGAGKTTLLNAICGYTEKTSGTVLIDGQDFDQNYAALKSIIGYVPQQDIVFDSLPLEKMLDYAAQMRMPEDTTPQERKKRINEVLEIVKLSEHKPTLIRKLSGGQRKRASIAVELLADPSLFFLDEPTSGLDAGTEENLMQSLWELSRKGKTVILVTHSTLKLDLCDRIIAMGKGGRLCYMGHSSDAPTFFGVERLPQIYDKLDHESAKWEASFAARRISHTSVGKKSTIRGRKSVGGWCQYCILTTRYADILLRNRKQILGIIGQSLIFALVLSWVTDDKVYHEFGSTQTVNFVNACLGMWMGLFLSIQEITKERSIIRREYMANLKLPPYVLSKATVLGLLAAAQVTILQISVVLLNHIFDKPLPDTSLLCPPMLENGITLWLTSFASICLGLAVSALVRQPERIAPYVLMPQIVLSGVLFDLGDGWFSKISYIVFTYWGNRALCIGADVNALGEAQAAAQAIPGATPAFEALADYTAELENLGECWCALLVLSILLLFLAMLILKNLSKDERG